ncbi:SDR family oxidoreductase [Streptomyces sp. NPDC005373]|uniref:SDR family NAD(P)-dependent oxidoreductase n=1 Tax=Streptomyces sp. NPDC005373 TaxID=3156879 RepID=UPI0033B3594A
MTTNPSNDVFSVAGKRVLITGGLSGLGRAVAESFAAQSAVVSVIGSSVPAYGSDELPGVRAVRGDVADASISDVVAGEIEYLGGLDILFANAGVSGDSTSGEGGVSGIEGVDWKLWDRVHAVNVDGVARVVAAAAPTLKAQRSGRIVITASIAGVRANANLALSYQSSKAASIALVKGLALEFAPYGVHVNGIAPGPFATGIGGGVFRTEAGAEKAARVVPLGRVGLPQEIVGTVQLLASEASSYLTGAIIPIDGGATAGAR